MRLLERIAPLAREINCLEMSTIAEVCTEKIASLVSARLASLYILDAGGTILHLQRCSHPYPIDKIVSLNRRPQGPMVLAAASGGMLVIDDISTHAKPRIRPSQRQFADNYLTCNCIVAPLVCHGRVVGVLNLADKQGAECFSSQDAALVELFRQLVGASVENMKLFEKIQHQATTDGMTGLVNHRAFYRLLEKELWRSRRYGGRISLIMIDMDNLKQINDVYGHRAGDRAIRTVAARLAGCVRQIDVAARYGGDEFAVILPNTALEEARVVGERMVASVAASPLVWEDGHVELSISVGVGEYDAQSSPEEITRGTDSALYLAKHAGKNTVCVFDPSAG